MKALALQQLSDLSFPWFTKTFTQWRHLTLAVLLPVVMKTEWRAPRALISISGRRSWGLVPHVLCPTLLSSMQGSLSICASSHWSKRLCSCHCIRLPYGSPCVTPLVVSRAVTKGEPVTASWACPGGRSLWLWLQGKSFCVFSFQCSLYQWFYKALYFGWTSFFTWRNSEQSETTMVSVQMRTYFTFSEKIRHDIEASQ